MEIAVKGPQREALARQLAPDLTFPGKTADPSVNAQVKVPVDLDRTRSDQQQVDGGHSPWQLDPMQVTQAFVTARFPKPATSPGKAGQSWLWPYTLVSNNGLVAVIDLDPGASTPPVQRVYLKRLVRQDETGIWSVIGYDPR